MGRARFYSDHQVLSIPHFRPSYHRRHPASGAFARATLLTPASHHREVQRGQPTQPPVQYMVQPRRYYFDLEGGDRPFLDPDGAVLAGLDAARAYAERIVRELRASGGYDDPRLVMLVKNEDEITVLSIPFVLLTG